MVQKSLRLPSSGTMQQREDAHWKMASEEGYAGFLCGCRVAKNRGAPSCLDQFSKEQFRRWHNETYGGHSCSNTATGFTHRGMQAEIHHKMWNLKEPLGPEQECDVYGRKYKIKTWKLDEHKVVPYHMFLN